MCDHRNLWNKASKFKNGSNKVAGVIDGVTGVDRLAQLFATKVDQVYNSVGFDKKNTMNDVLDKVETEIADCDNSGIVCLV